MWKSHWITLAIIKRTVCEFKLLLEHMCRRPSKIRIVDCSEDQWFFTRWNFTKTARKWTMLFTIFVGHDRFRVRTKSFRTTSREAACHRPPIESLSSMHPIPAARVTGNFRNNRPREEIHPRSRHLALLLSIASSGEMKKERSQE